MSALDLRHETLMNVASNEHEKHHEAPVEADVAANVSRTLDLWQHLLLEDKKTLESGGRMTLRMRKRATRTLLRGFACASTNKRFHVRNLFSYERRFSGCTKMSSDSESVEVDDLQRPLPLL